jgi:hypothetical protein
VTKTNQNESESVPRRPPTGKPDKKMMAMIMRKSFNAEGYWARKRGDRRTR